MGRRRNVKNDAGGLLAAGLILVAAIACCRGGGSDYSPTPAPARSTPTPLATLAPAVNANLAKNANAAANSKNKSTAKSLVDRPQKEREYPAGASAVCSDGTLSYSRNRRGTCSHHGGVARWLY